MGVIPPKNYFQEKISNIGVSIDKVVWQHRRSTNTIYSIITQNLGKIAITPKGKWVAGVLMWSVWREKIKSKK